MIKRRFLAIGISAAIGAAAVVSFSVSDHDAKASGIQSSMYAVPARAVKFPTNAVVHKSAEETQKEIRCLALNIYWEARSEPLDGQIAVAAVTLNRVEDRRFPDEICNVVRQGGEIRRHRCQFSWWCDGKKDDPLEAEAWRRANTLARLTAAGVIEDPTGGAMWYHADYVDPYWADAKKQVTKIGRHIFYTLPKRAPTQVSANLENN